ncbi:MAG: C40 family peptidase, partial [Bacillota bacterium]|nr:C40 family peptidase [Bacillota bacterium]
MKNIIKLIAFFLLVVPFLGSVASNAEAAEKQDLTDYAKKFIGVPYSWGGSTPQGFDCSGFLTYVYKEYGIQLPRTSAEQYAQGQDIDSEEMVPGDLVFFTTYKQGPSHAGIYLGDNKFIHASPQGIEIASLQSGYYKTRYLGAKRYIQPEAVASLAPLKKGQIGTVYIKKKITLWQRNNNNKLTAVRVLNPGEQYRVYDKDD